MKALVWCWSLYCLGPFQFVQRDTILFTCSLILVMFSPAAGVCTVLADTNTEMVLKGGSSLDLTLTYPKNSLTTVKWNFNGTKFADYYPSRNYTFRASQFSRRLKGFNDKIGVTLKDLQPQDSGTFSVVAVGPEGQYPTQDIKVYIESKYTFVEESSVIVLQE